MNTIEAKLAPSVVLIVDDDDARAARVGATIRAHFGTSYIKLRCWHEQLDDQTPMLTDLAILIPGAMEPGRADPVPAMIEQFGRTPVVVLAAPSESQRAVNAVLDGASDAMVMESSFLDGLPFRIRRALARVQNRPGADRRRTAISQSLRRTKQENRRLRDKLGHVQTAALLDPLTGLGNRRLLDQRLSNLWDHSVLSDADMSCLMIDIDNFKSANDTLGHAAGDRLLVLVAKVLLDQCRQDDVAARIGGDEFVVLLSGASAEQAQHIAQRILTRFEEESQQLFLAASTPRERAAGLLLSTPNVRLHPTDPRVMATLSIGGASRRQNRPSASHELLAQADSAMYAAKRAGKNRVELCVRGESLPLRWAAAG